METLSGVFGEREVGVGIRSDACYYSLRIGSAATTLVEERDSLAKLLKYDSVRRTNREGMSCV